MTPQQADYCDKLQSGNIEVAVPCESSMRLGQLQIYFYEMKTMSVEIIEQRRPDIAFKETQKIVSNILTGLGK